MTVGDLQFRQRGRFGNWLISTTITIAPVVLQFQDHYLWLGLNASNNKLIHSLDSRNSVPKSFMNCSVAPPHQIIYLSLQFSFHQNFCPAIVPEA
jgi:hypothetical protein